MTIAHKTTWLAMQHPYGAKPWLVVEQSTHLPICTGIKIESAAHLIAAAPDLLVALKLALPLCEGFDDADIVDEGEQPIVAPVIAAIRAAIAKAEGR